jgi:hypothetical protein
MLQYLRDIRAGKFKYEELIGEVEQRMRDLEVLKKNTTIRHSVDKDAINDLYLELVSAWEHPA